MTKNTKKAAIRQEQLEKALRAENVVDMRLFFDAKKEQQSEYWLSAMILCTDNITLSQKIRLARQNISDEEVLNFFFERLYKRGKI
ncbi:MAG: hypothetical protein J6N49_04505 [Alphaproteobacteria bacterium]|nr:hypothetical protein [Alphaproteobacteria bacterium]